MSDLSRTLAALAAFARLGWREAAADRAGLFGRSVLFSIPVLVFAAIWRATPLDGLVHDADRLTWYVTVTEAIVFSVGYVFREIETDIGSGAIEAALTRPLPTYWRASRRRPAARRSGWWRWASSAPGLPGSRPASCRSRLRRCRR